MTMRVRPIVIAMALIAGCSTSALPDDGDDPLADMDVSDASAAQVAEISDGEATADEYAAAFQRFRECVSAAGFELTDVTYASPVYEYAVPDAAVQDGVDMECYRAEFYYVDVLWQGSDVVQDARNADEPVPLLQNCLRERGIEPGDTAGEVDEQLREAGIEVAECVP